MGALLSCASGIISKLTGGSGGGGGASLKVVSFDGSPRGQDVNTARFTVSGRGAALANTSVEQDQCYFEVKVARRGSVGVGLSRKKRPSDLGSHLGDGKTSWCFRTDAFGDLEEGQVIGCSYDQLHSPALLEFYLDGEKLDGQSIKGARGHLYPAVSVGDGAMVIANFSRSEGNFAFPPPAGFTGIVPHQDLISV